MREITSYRTILYRDRVTIYNYEEDLIERRCAMTIRYGLVFLSEKRARSGLFGGLKRVGDELASNAVPNAQRLRLVRLIARHEPRAHLHAGSHREQFALTPQREPTASTRRTALHHNHCNNL